MDVIELGKKYAEMYDLTLMDASQELISSSGGHILGQKVMLKYQLKPEQLNILINISDNQVSVEVEGNNEVIFIANKGMDIEKLLKYL